MKLNGKPENFSMLRIDSSTIAICYGEKDIRVWDLKNQDSSILRLTQEKGFDSNEIIHCLSYSSKKGKQFADCN